MATKKTPAKKGEKKEFKVYKKRSGRYAVVARGGKLLNAEKKVEVLQAQGLVKKLTKKAEAAPAAE